MGDGLLRKTDHTDNKTQVKLFIAQFMRKVVVGKSPENLQHHLDPFIQDLSFRPNMMRLSATSNQVFGSTKFKMF